MEELYYYSNIEYTPGWYYTKYPKFWNIDCYRILADYSNNPEKYKGREETKDCEPMCDPEDIHLIEDSNKNISKKRDITSISESI
jgi:hypothetical protein